MSVMGATNASAWCAARACRQGTGLAQIAWRRWPILRFHPKSLKATGLESRVKDDGRSLAEVLGDGLDVEGVLVDADERAAINTAIDALGERNATILRLRLDGLSQRDVASRIGISHQRVGQLEVQAMDRLRRVLLAILGEHP